jgi:N-acetylglucosaminyl-diphospho-decaprenol L-rhamnosyltransferase
VLISNPDVVYPPGAVDALLELLRRRERAAFAIARLTHPSGELQTAAGDLPTHAEALLGRRLSWRGVQRRGGGVWWHGWAHDEEREVGHGAEACYLVRRAAVAEIGLQDERFVLDWEGLDWSARAREAGWQIWFCPTATVTHIGGTSLRQVPGRWVVSTHRGMYLYLRARTPAVLRPLLAAAVAARAALKLAAVTAGAALYESSRRDAVQT